MRGLGWIKDRELGASDKPDETFETWRADAGETLPDAVSLKNLVLSVLDQGQLGSCTANATAQALRMGHVRQGIANPMLASRLMTYFLARAYDHATGQDTGTELRLIFEALAQFGFCPEEVWPYSDDTTGARPLFTRMPSPDAFAAAYDQRTPPVYRRIASTGDAKLRAIKHALSMQFPVVFGCQVSTDFCSGNFDPAWPLDPPSAAEVAGGHAMLFAEYAGEVFTVLNSWSDQFGDGGYVLFSSDYVLTTEDLWVPEHVPVEGET